MTLRAVIRCCAVLVLALGAGGCGPKETPEQHLARLRMKHEIFEGSRNTIYPKDGDPYTLVDLEITNQGVEPLPELTVLVRVNGPDGVERHRSRVTVSLEGVRPGVGVQVGAKVPGLVVTDDDEVFVELEANLTPEELRSLPEFKYVAGQS